MDGGWDTAERIDSNDTGDSGLPEVALDPLGNGVAVWAESNEPSATVGSIVANRFVDGAWGTAELIENNGAADGVHPRVALDPFGRGLAAWWQLRGMVSEIGVNRFD